MSLLRSPRLLALPPLLLLVVSGVRADGARSPFLRPSATPAATAAAPAAAAEIQLQFCGIFGDGAQKLFCIYSGAKNRSVWLAVDQAGPDDLQVQSYDAENNILTVQQAGQVLNLPLQTAKIVASAGRAAAASGASNALVNTVRVQPTPADERQRLEAVAAEVRRRRAQRQAAANGQPPPAAPR